MSGIWLVLLSLLLLPSFYGIQCDEHKMISAGIRDPIWCLIFGCGLKCNWVIITDREAVIQAENHLWRACLEPEIWIGNVSWFLIILWVILHVVNLKYISFLKEELFLRLLLNFKRIVLKFISFPFSFPTYLALYMRIMFFIWVTENES